MQNWTSEGCVTVVGEKGIVSCSCNHLTNFAVLVVSALSVPKSSYIYSEEEGGSPTLCVYNSC